MTTDNHPYLQHEMKAIETLYIESIYNQEFELWEVSMLGQLMGSFETEEEAAKCAVNLHLAFETGYTNGSLVGYKDSNDAKEKLKNRGIKFVPRFDESL